MRTKVAVATVLAGLALTAPAALPEAAPLTATAIRIAPHPGLVRVVVDFTGGARDSWRGCRRATPTRSATASCGSPAPPPPRTHARCAGAGRGASARVRQRSGRIVIRLQGAARRFRYVGYQALRGPERLAIDSGGTPPEPAAEIRRAPGGCLSLRRFDVARRSVSAGGRERDLFEHSLVVRLRARTG